MTSEKSQLKFAKSERTGELIGFVSRHSKTRKLMGVREDSRFGKQICVLSEDLKGTIEPNILYSVELKPMHNAKGYVVVAATPVLFQAHVETIIVPKTLYQVTVTFGNKKIFFDPKDGKSAMSRTIDGVLEILKGRKDIRHQESVINDYLNQAQALVRRMESDGFIYTKRVPFRKRDQQPGSVSISLLPYGFHRSLCLPLVFLSFASSRMSIFRIDESVRFHASYQAQA